jgi:hypothetical protein
MQLLGAPARNSQFRKQSQLLVKNQTRSHQEPGAEFAWNPRRQAQIGAITSCFCLVIGTETSRGTGGKNLGAGPAATSSPE